MNRSISDQPAAEFFTPERQQRLDLITHLIPNSRQPVLLRSPAEAGKSYFLKQFRNQASKTWSICTLEADELAISPLDALELALNQLEGGDKSIQARLVAWSHVGRVLVVIVEDAHDLDEGCLSALFKLVEQYSCLRLLLSSSENLGDRIESNCQLIDLEPFSQKQTSEYAKLRVNAKGLEFVNLAGIDDVVLFIETGGLPGRINDVLAQMQINPKKVSQTKKVSSTTFVLSAVVASMLVALLLTYGFWGGDEADVRPKSAIALPAESKRSPEMVLKNEADINLVKLKEVAKDKKISLAEEQEKDLAVDVVKKEIILASVEVKHPPAPIKKVVAEPKIIASPNSVKKSARVKLVETVENAIKTADPKTELDGHHAWLKSQPAKHYTLQLLGVSQEASVQQYIASKKALSGLRYFRNKKDKGSWYTVIYNSYTDRQSAEKEAKNLPKALKGVKPWVRSIESVRADMFL